jgi:anti-anti-sigma regulatory factor
MLIDRTSQDTVIVDLAPEPEMRDELEAISENVHTIGDRDVVVDFSNADIVTSSSLSKLLKLRQLMINSGRRLTLCGLSGNTKGIFTVTALDQVFEFAANKSAVLTNA